MSSGKRTLIILLLIALCVIAALLRPRLYIALGDRSLRNNDYARALSRYESAQKYCPIKEYRTLAEAKTEEMAVSLIAEGMKRRYSEDRRVTIHAVDGDGRGTYARQLYVKDGRSRMDYEVEGSDGKMLGSLVIIRTEEKEWVFDPATKTYTSEPLDHRPPSMRKTAGSSEHRDKLAELGEWSMKGVEDGEAIEVRVEFAQRDVEEMMRLLGSEASPSTKATHSVTFEIDPDDLSTKRRVLRDADGKLILDIRSSNRKAGISIPPDAFTLPPVVDVDY